MKIKNLYSSDPSQLALAWTPKAQTLTTEDDSENGQGFCVFGAWVDGK